MTSPQAPAGLGTEVAPVRPGEELDWDALATYLRQHLAGVDGIDGLTGEMQVLQFPNGSANLTYLVAFGERRLVVRRPPFGRLAPGAHDMRREHRVLARLWRGFDRAPRAFLFCDDHGVVGSDFLVVEYRAGEVIWGAVPVSMRHHSDVGRRVGRAVVDALADLHVLPPEAVGLERLGRPQGFVERQVAGWAERWELVAGEPVAQGETATLMAAVGDRLARVIPRSPLVAILHSDYKLDNCQFDPAQPDRVKSIFDWDMATLGDPLVDLGTLLNYWPDPADAEDEDGAALIVPGMASLGLPTRAELVERYAAATGFDLDAVPWYEAFASWKTAVVLKQLYVRYLRGESTDERMAARGELVGQQARRAATLLDRAGL